MPITHGRDSVIGSAVETVYGTAVAADQWHRIISESLKRKVTKVPRPHLVGSSTAAMQRAHFIQSDTVEGDIEMEMMYEGFGRWLYHTLGKTPTTGTVVDLVYPHTYLLGPDLPLGLTLTRYIGRPISGNRRAEVFEGCKIASARFKFGVGDVGRASFSIIGETSSARGDAATQAPTFSTNDVPFLHHQIGSLTFNAVSYTVVKSVEITVDNALDRRMHLGSLVTKEPKRSGFQKITMRVTMEYEDENLITAFTADTQGDVAVTFTGIGGRDATITLHNGFITDYGDPTSGPGIIERTVEWTAESDGTDDGLSFLLNNLQATALLA